MPEFINQYGKGLNYAPIISFSRDGKLLTRIGETYSNIKTISVPHNRRAEALQQVIERLKTTNHLVVITPDGPRGPRYKPKRGLAYILKETNAPLLSLNWTANRYWELNTWDRLRIPKPFTTIHITFTPAQGPSDLPND
ncbi:MAG: DUF374 domain-containing protein [Chlamydiia bacterium]|nr:DUF374 domain-containing protein [Chlamydiia bacterium]